ncbi:two-component system sensor histidine kinase UhpB [Bradyrhizobium sp. USDA 4369]
MMKSSMAPVKPGGTTNAQTAWKQAAASFLKPLSFRSLRMRLIAIVLLIDCTAAALTTTVVILNARANTRREIVSSMQLADALTADTIRLLQFMPASVLLKSIDLHFQSVRHIRISVIDAEGRSVAAPAPSSGKILESADIHDAPEWFTRLVAPPVERNNFPIIAASQRLGTVVITSDPSDEINEAWNYVRALVFTAFCLNTAVLIALFLLFGRILEPLTRLVSGLKHLGHRNYAVRLPNTSMTELAIIADHFNQTAEALASAYQANRSLNVKLLTAQDEERRRTALELHDEVGPCLFTLEAGATSIARMSKDRPDLVRLHQRALDVVDIVSQIQGINRRLLDRLRPMALGQIPLRDCLVKLLVEFDRTENTPEFEQTIGELHESYGAILDLTIYRCVQEGMFNAIRHAQAQKIVLMINQKDLLGRQFVFIQVADDGVGLRRPFKPGVGLAGMRERVEALSGAFNLESSSCGTVLTVVLATDGGDVPLVLLSGDTVP